MCDYPPYIAIMITSQREKNTSQSSCCITMVHTQSLTLTKITPWSLLIFPTLPTSFLYSTPPKSSHTLNPICLCFPLSISKNPFPSSHLEVMKNSSLIKSWMHIDVAAVTNTLFAGLAMALNTMNGSLVWNSKTAKCSITGWCHGLGHLNLGRFCLLILPAVAFSHWVLMHLHSDCTYLSTNVFLFLSFFPF